MRMTIRKFIIILDDVWEYYPLEDVGIPFGKNGCKLILTSRKKDVCYQMNCDKLVEVMTLSEQEAWYLFRDNLDCCTILSQDVEKIAQAVARECSGLPLGIVVLSRIMKGVDDIHEWRITLQELQESKFKEKRMEDEVFAILRFSYERLGDKVLQQCFLHISLYPEDEEVDMTVLILDFIDFGLIVEETRRLEFDKGNAVLNKLVKSCLLEKGQRSSCCVKMHDLVRDMVINLTNGHFMVKAGQRLREILSEREWIKSLEKVSLMRNNIEKIESNISPQCPNILTLLFRHNPLIIIPDSFFRHMETLQILNLSNTNIHELPDSFSNLENITTLHLSHCRMLRSLPSLAKLKALRTLNLYRSGIKEIPKGMERLCSLMYLDLGETEGLKGMQWPTGILPQLSHLQFLNFMRGPKITKAKELMSLRKLESVLCWFDKVDEGNTCLRCLQGRMPRVNHWEIAFGRCHFRMIGNKKVSIVDYNMEGQGKTFQLINK